MKALKTTLGLLLAASLVFATGCNKNQNASKENETKKTITLGTQEGTKYTNEYFGLELKLPEGWTIASDEEKEAVFQTGQDVIAENNEELAEKLDLAAQRTLYLLLASKYPMTYEGPNPNIICIAENLGLLGSASVKTGKDYIDITKTGLEQTGVPYTFSDVTTVKLGGKDFDTIEATLDAGEIILTQKYYAAVIDGYALVFINSYTNEDEVAEINAYMDSISFK